MRINKNGTPDLRYRTSKADYKAEKARQTRLFIQQLVGCALLGAIAGAILMSSLFTPNKALVSPKGTGEVKVVQKVEAKETPWCYDVITCIRDVGEKMGETNQHIITMIKIAKAESGLRADAMNKNTNGTFDLGVFQINDCHSKRISRADRLDYEKNITFAYQLHQEQGHKFTAWSVWNKGLIK